MVAYFHDYPVVAPLKPGAASQPDDDGGDFHDYPVVAPLKPELGIDTRGVMVPISTTTQSWPH